MFEKIQEIIADKLSIDVEEITLDSSRIFRGILYFSLFLNLLVS